MKYSEYSQATSNAQNVSFMIKLAAFIGLFSFLVMSSVHAQDYTKVTRLGTSEAVCPEGVQTVADLQAYFANNSDAVRSILNDSGWTGSADDLFAAVANGEVSEVAYPVGTRVAWMGANDDGTYIARDYREWAGTASMESFRVDVSSGCQVYEIAIPKACCNISLVSVGPDNSEQCNPATPPAALATDAAPATAAAPASSEASRAEASPLALVPFFGLFAGSETRPRYEEAWDMDMKDSSGIIGLRAGLMKGLSEKTSVFTQLSYYDRQGINEFNTYPENNLAIDIGVDRRLSEKAFIGGGIGLWNVDDSDYRDTSLFGHVGGDIGESNFQWILEGRVFDSDSMLDSFSDNKMISVGVRYLVK